MSLAQSLHYGPPVRKDAVRHLPRAHDTMPFFPHGEAQLGGVEVERGLHVIDQVANVHHGAVDVGHGVYLSQK